MSLNPKQNAAAQAATDQPLKIIAGAGAGKTETLAARYVAMVQAGIAPERIVLLTFTEDAAAEMRARVMLRLHEAKIDLAPHALLHPWISTFHGFAMRLLHEYGFDVGLPPTPRVLSDDDQAELWQSIRETVESEQQLTNGYTPLDHETYRWDNDETWNKVMGVIGALRRGGGAPSELDPHPQLHAQQTTAFAAHRAQLIPLIEHCFNDYTAQLHARGVLDYDELIQATLRLIRTRPEILTQFDVVMVDEFQDTNRPQLALLHQLQPTLKRTTVVGDPRQAIYGWNSARAESIYDFPFQKTVPGEQHALTENYRSHPAIVHLANWALHGSELSSLAPLEPAESRSVQRPASLLDEPVVSLHTLPTTDDEAALIASEIVRLHEHGVAFRDIAVLLRSRTELQKLREALGLAGVPYIVSGGTGFYLHWAVRLTSSLLRLVADPLDRAAWAHILESPLIGVGPNIIARRSEDFASDQPRQFMQWLDDPETVPAALPDRHIVVARLKSFRAFFDVAHARWGLLQPGAYLDWLWRASGIELIALSSGDTQTQLVLKQLLRDADDYAAAHPLEGIAGFAAVLQQRVVAQPRVALPTPPITDAVEIATVHQAKGREWPVVFVYHTALPGARSAQVDHVLWDEQWKLVVSDGSSKSETDNPLHQLRADFRRRQRNEERSIWYVALTRAQHRLFLLHSGCLLDGDDFADVRAKQQRQAQGAAPAKQDEAVHFFHELWQQVRLVDQPLNDLIKCVPYKSPTTE